MVVVDGEVVEDGQHHLLALPLQAERLLVWRHHLLIAGGRSQENIFFKWNVHHGSNQCSKDEK